jgi:orotidine-5'-phosphate decarboxylase
MSLQRCQVIVALDFNESHGCLAWIEKLDPQYCALKIGSELFTSSGPQIVRACIERGFRVFLDLKFHDIPHTVAQSVKAAAELGVWMLNVHAIGGPRMLEAARLALEPYGDQRPLLIAVTVLTSHDEASLKCLGIERELNEQVQACAQLAYDAGLDGVVCSGLEVPFLKTSFGSSFLTVTPGIRLSTDPVDDQIRVLTPLQAKHQGSDYLVIGRSLRRASHPDLMLKQIYQELNSD